MKINTPQNAPFYMIIVAVVKEDFSNGFVSFKKGEELVLDQDYIRVPGFQSNTSVLVGRRDGCNGFSFYHEEMDKFDFVVKTIKPYFKIGDAVIRKSEKTQHIAFRISSYNLRNNSIWYQDTWGDATNCASGSLQDDIRYASPEEKERDDWALNHSYKNAVD